MPRPLRTACNDSIHHILNRGNDRKRVFHKDGDYYAFLKLLGEMKAQYSMSLYAYCVMPNHFHMVVRTKQGDDLSRGMQWFLTAHVRRYHEHYRSSGHLWQGRFKSFEVVGDEQFLTVLRYVEGNPVRAGLVETAAGWVWSSHRGRCGVEADSLIDPLPTPYPGDWATYVDEPLTGSELAKVRKKV